MFEKIIKVSRVGLLNNGTPKAVDLGKVTLLYGDNGRGKSMLSAVFGSLGENDSGLVLERQTIGEQSPPEIHLHSTDGAVKFDGSSWYSPGHLIAVFDSRFVDQNVYTGFAVGADHRKGLLDVVLGAKGVKLASEIDRIAADIAPITRAIGLLEKQFDAVRGPYPITEFAALPVDRSAAEDALENAKKVKMVAENAQEVLSIDELTPLADCTIDPVRVNAVLNTSLDDIADDAGERISAHLSAHGTGELEEDTNWLADGVKRMDEDCPFCGQDLTSASGLVDAFKSRFSDAYADHLNELRELQHEIDNALGAAALALVEAQSGTNRALAARVARFTSLEDVELEVTTVVGAMEMARVRLSGLTEAKIANPANAAIGNDDVAGILSDVDALNTAISAYNKSVDRINAARADARSGADSSKIGDATDAFERSKASLARTDKLSMELCSDYQQQAAAKSKLEEEKREARSALDAYTESTLSGYEQKLNETLQRLHAEFRIEKTKMAMAGGKPRIAYGLKLRGESVPLESRGTEGGRSFSNTLSEGDKRTLALAFFIAKLDLDPDLNDTIVIIDDPVSSFDVGREHATRIELIRLAGATRQLMVLSHDARFLSRLDRGLTRSSVDFHQLRLARTDNDHSVIEPCQLSDLIVTSYQEDYANLERFVTGEHLDRRTIVHAIRSLLETNLEMRFSGGFGAANTLGNMIQAIKNSDAGVPIAQLKPDVTSLSILNDFSTEWTHGGQDARDISELADSELKSMCESALTFARAVNRDVQAAA